MSVKDPQGNPVDLIGSPFHLEGVKTVEAAFPPSLGEHTEQVLREVLGMEAAAIEELRKNKIVS